MKMIAVLVSLLLVSPLLFSAEKAAQIQDQEALKNEVQTLISSKVLLEKDGVGKLQAVSTDLTADSKDELYNQNRKNGAISWLNLVVPTLGSWIVGDKEGAVAGIIGDSLGLVATIAGTVMFEIGSHQYSSTTYSDSYYITVSYPVIDQPIGTAGLIVMIAGMCTIIVTDFMTIMGAYNFVNNYNKNLKTGLGIDKLSFEDTNPAFERMKSRFAYETVPRANNLVNFEIASFAF